MSVFQVCHDLAAQQPHVLHSILLHIATVMESIGGQVVSHVQDSLQQLQAVGAQTTLQAQRLFSTEAYVQNMSAMTDRANTLKHSSCSSRAERESYLPTVLRLWPNLKDKR